MHGLHDATHQSPVARPPARMALPGGHALPGDGSDLDGDLDIILIMQERDAYKKETEKLRQIVDRQRFIIKSLQDQFARVQGASAASTPSARQHGLSPEQPAQYQYQHQHGSESADPPHDAPAARNALGLSSLEVSSLPTATPPERKASQGSQLGDLPTRAPDAAAAGQPETHGSARPWAKSTRLSEIYADYSARHNSVAPMFKTSPAAWAADADGSATHRQPLSEPQPGGSSFVESLKTSTARSELLAEWGVMPADSDHSDLSSEGRVSSLALESSRNPSASIDIGEREGLRANALGLQGHIPTVPSPTRSLDPADRPGAVGGTADPVGAEADQGASMASPASEAASEDLVLRPVSLIANNHAAPEQPRQRDTPLSAGLADERSQWRASRVAAYEYRALDMGTLDDFGDGSGYAKPTGQSPRPPAQQEQPWRPPSSDSLGSDHDSGPAVRWAADLSTPAQPAASASPYEQHASRARADSSQPSEGGSIAQTSISSSSARPKSDGRSDQGAALALQGPSSVYSTASTARGIPTGPPLTSLHNIDVQIKDSRVKIDERGKEVNVYMIDVVWRREITGLSLQEILAESQQAEVVLWTVEKRYSDFLNLNGQLRHVIHRERLLEKLERLPDKDIFRPNAPSKSDKRKLWFERYLRRALSLGFVDKRPLLEFLSSDQTMEPEKKMPILLGHKEGFLVKKGKNFGGWKRRYYVCKSNKPVLEYSETPGGAIIGTINLSGATVKTGKARAEDLALALARPKGLSKETDMFRHAFLIEEQPKREGRDTVAHPLWADSDRERDEWVMALRYVIVRDSDGPERAMKEVTKLVKHARSKESKPLMIHQIQTSLTHEQGARRSVEHTRQKEEEQQQQRSAAKFGSPLSKQMWPHNAPPDDAAGGASVLGIVAAPGLEAGPDANAGLPDTGAPSMRPSPAAIATSLSTSFAGYPESMSDQSERHSLHYVASEISTIESSIYSSYNGNSVGSRLNDVSSRSIDDRNSCASAPESPRSPVRPTGTAAPRAAASDYWAPSASHAGARPGAPALAPVAAQTRVQFTKNSVGRIVHEEETVPDLPQITPRVTDDILGVGRQKPGRSDQAGSGSDGPTRSREDKKRGRITFMWGKRKPTENEPPLPDLALPKAAGGSSTSTSSQAGGGSAAAAAGAAARRMRRGSINNGNTRSVQAKLPPFRGPVFGEPLDTAVEQTRVREHYHLPAVVYRCIEYLDAKMACLEEGIYRQSGSSVVLSQLRKEFNTNRDYNLMKLSKPPDVHAVASLLKAYLRELPENILTARLHQDFARVVDLAERHDRVDELGQLVSDLPLANYTLLRALTAHLIRIVEKATTNRMTLRNIGIVFSPSLGIPVGIFSLLMIEFDYIFWVNDSGVPEPRLLARGAGAAGSDDARPPLPPYALNSQMASSVPAGIERAHGSADSAPGSSSAQHPGESAAAGPARWYTQLDAEAGGATGLSQDLSRYPGMTPSVSWQHSPQPETTLPPPQGRSNRNSIQYKVGAPRELITQEAGITVPGTISESDFDEDDFDDRISPGGDPMMRLNHNYGGA